MRRRRRRVFASYHSPQLLIFTCSCKPAEIPTRARGSHPASGAHNWSLIQGCRATLDGRFMLGCLPARCPCPCQNGTLNSLHQAEEDRERAKRPSHSGGVWECVWECVCTTFPPTVFPVDTASARPNVFFVHLIDTARLPSPLSCRVCCIPAAPTAAPKYSGKEDDIVYAPKVTAYTGLTL